MTDQTTLETLAADYTAAWNSGSAEAVASFFTEDGKVQASRGWFDAEDYTRQVTGT